MQLSPFSPIAAAAVLLLAFACDNSPDPLSPNDKPSLAAGGNDKNQKAEGQVVVTFGQEQYTFNARAKNGEFSGHFSWTFAASDRIQTMEGDVTCLVVVPGTTHAMVRAFITGSNIGLEGQTMAWNVTDGGKALPDAGSSVHPTTPGECAADFPEEVNDEINVRVKP